MQVKGNPGQRYVLQRSYTGKRVRLRNSRRGESNQFDLSRAIAENWKTQAGEFGLKWSVKVKQQKWATPTPNEILGGLRKWWMSQVTMRLEDKPKNTDLVIQHYNKAFEDILEIFQVDEPD